MTSTRWSQESATTTRVHSRARNAAAIEEARGDRGDAEDDRVDTIAGIRKKTVRNQWTTIRIGIVTCDDRRGRVTACDVPMPDATPALRTAGSRYARRSSCRGGLQHASDDNVDGLADHPARVVDDHHRPIVEIGQPWLYSLPSLRMTLHHFARQTTGLSAWQSLI